MIPMVLPSTPHPVSPDTWVIPTLAPEASGAYIGANSLVIRGAQPAIVDTGCALVREHWIDQVVSLVDPHDVRWIVLSHDDHDHIGNLPWVLDACPQATLVASFAIFARLTGDVELPVERMRWVDVGESVHLGDRELVAVRPPLFDSPATRGFFDTSSGVLWAADSFGSLLTADGLERADVPDDLYAASFEVLNSWNTPWMEWIDATRFADHVRSTSSLPIEAIASGHGPVLRGADIADAFTRTCELVGKPAVPRPGQPALDALVQSAFGQAA